MTAARATEVVSDPTNVLALACAARLTERPAERVRLCTIHQTLRAQSVPDVPGHAQHFRLFALASAGRGLAEDGFERRAVVEHVAIFDRMFDAAGSLACRFDRRKAQVFASPARGVLGDRVAADLARALPHAVIERRELDSTYYAGLRVLYGADSPRTGEFVAIADTGNFDWVAQLTANRKLRYIASGIGIQLFRFLFADDDRAGGGRG